MVFPLLPSDWFQSVLDSLSSLFLLFIYLFYSMTSSNSQRRNARKVRNSNHLHGWESLCYASFHVTFSGMKLCDNNKDLPLSTEMQWSDDRHDAFGFLNNLSFFQDYLKDLSFILNILKCYTFLTVCFFFFFIHSVSVGWIL